jgi:hypothetical protein
MFDCYIDLYIFNFDISKKQLQIVSLYQDTFVALSQKMDATDIRSVEDSLKETISNHLVCNMTQIKPRLFDVSIEKEIIRINYITTSPIDLRLINCYYLDMENLSHENKTLKKALLYV